jgi:catechol 2,3-dioxygenase-like lactoylglutathione lyase family enzyme
MPITSIDVISVPVSDQQRAKRWYTEQLGFRLIRDEPMGPDARWIQVGPQGDTGASLVLVTWFPTMAPGSLKGTVIGTADLEATIGELKGRGVRIEGEIEEAPWGRFVTLEDPDGNEFVLQAPPR